jgi:hypothetical protein
MNHSATTKSVCRSGLARILALISLLSSGSAAVAGQPRADWSAGLTTVELTTQESPPSWAFWQRHLLEQLYPAALEFVNKYTRADGTLIWRDEWPGFDGSDDGYESFYNFPLYYVLGGPAPIHDLSRKLWDGVTGQFTEYGQIHNEFDAHYDWMHHGESYTYFYFFGLADPTVAKDRERAVRFAGLYLNEDPEALNYDFEHRIIRSPINGSRGPHFVNTAEDWVTHRPILAGYPLPYDDIPGVSTSDGWNDDQQFAAILETMNRRMMRGDVPLNLTSTSLVLNAYMYTGDPKYKTWIEDYVGAWRDRVEQNGGKLPDNVGLSGKIGETMDGKWWGGYYGWRWPHGLFNQLEATTIGACNARLVSGDAGHLDLPRSVLRLVEGEGRKRGSHVEVPHRHGDDGWYDYRRMNPKYPIHLWYASRAREDWQRVQQLTDPEDWNRLNYHKGKGDSEHLTPWLGFLEGQNPEYPVQILRSTYQETLRRLEMIRQDRTTPDQQDVHHWQQRNPVVLEGLVQTMLGGPNHIYHGGLLHVSLRYFDPRRRRPGVPPDVAVLVDRIGPEGVSLTLVNLHPTAVRDVVVQGGAFGEHEITRVRQVVHYPFQFHTVQRRFFQARLQPGSVGRLEIDMKRFANRPTYAFPWHGDRIP